MTEPKRIQYLRTKKIYYPNVIHPELEKKIRKMLDDDNSPFNLYLKKLKGGKRK